MAKIITKRERVKFASDNVAGACTEVLEAIIKATEGDRSERKIQISNIWKS